MAVLTMCRGCGAPIAEGAPFCSRCGVSTGTAPQPAYERQPEQDRSLPLKALAIAAGVALLIGAVAGFANAKDPAPKGRIVAQMPVGPAGGTVPFDGGGKVEVPPGAVSQETPITVYKTVVTEEVSVAPADGGSPILFPAGTLPIYVFGPFDLVFAVPVTIVIPLPPGLTGRIFFLTSGNLQFVAARIVGNTAVVTVRGFGPGGLVPVVV